MRNTSERQIVMKTTNITHKEFVRRKVLGMNGLAQTQTGQDPRDIEERLTFINDINEVQKDKLREYNIWYVGDGDEILNFYTRTNAIDYNTDPIYNRNKKSYFWAVSSTEGDVKRTHSGQPKNIVDTLVSIVGVPKIGVGSPDSVLAKVDARLKKILKDNKFAKLLTQESRPLTFVEGWGAFKINWDTSFRDTPILLYYRADSVDFVYKYKQLRAIIYRDYYQDEKGQNYVLYETRRIDKGPCLIIEKELFKINGNSQVLTPMKLTELKQLQDTIPVIKIENFDRFLGAPSIFYEDSSGDCYGKSIFAGKIDLFDDLDQCYSQAANGVRRSTVHEYFNSLYLERDEQSGMPIMPKDYDRKYIMYRGIKGGDGTGGIQDPVQVTQPKIDFAQYAQEEQNILLNIISGIMSPATLGIDIAKKDNAEAQREKEKVTIFTRNLVMEQERECLETVVNDLLVADEFMHSTDNSITCKNYDVYVQYDEFADTSFESKLETVLNAWQAGIMSDDMAVEYLYGNSISKEKRDRELQAIKEAKEQAEQSPQSPEDMGMFGALGADNEYNEEHVRDREQNREKLEKLELGTDTDE